MPAGLSPPAPRLARVQRVVWASAVALAGFLVVAALQLALVVVPVMLILSTLPGSAALRIGAPVCMATVGAAMRPRRRKLPARLVPPTRCRRVVE